MDPLAGRSTAGALVGEGFDWRAPTRSPSRLGSMIGLLAAHLGRRGRDFDLAGVPVRLQGALIAVDGHEVRLTPRPPGQARPGGGGAADDEPPGLSPRRCGLIDEDEDAVIGYVDRVSDGPGAGVGRGTLPAVVVASWLTLTGGGSFAATVQQDGDTCSPSGTVLSITAFDNKFDKRCLAAPADQAFRINFSNLDRGIPHNVAIYEDETAQKLYFRGERVDGPGKTTYSVQGLSAGKFFFRCDPHPEMNGTFVSG